MKIEVLSLSDIKNDVDNDDDAEGFCDCYWDNFDCAKHSRSIPVQSCTNP